jgi:predicted dinucleotide-binding enzyme
MTNMNIGVLGTGIVAKTLADKLSALGHAVKLGTRNVAATLARNEPDMAGGPALRVWLETHPRVSLVPFEEAARHGEILVNALSGQGALAALGLAGEANLAGKLMLDISNPLDFSRGMPPSLTVANTDSLGEQIQRAFPKLLVVKTLNTVSAFLMVDPGQLAKGEHTMFVCGDDEAAKGQATRILTEWFGWKDVVDLGDLSNARATEMYVVLWARIYGALKNPMFNVRVVRA